MKTALSIIVIVLSLIILAGFGSQMQQIERERIQSAPTAPSQNSIVEKSAARDAFVGGCTGEGVSASTCACMFDELEAALGVNGIVQMGLEMQSMSDLPPVAVDAITRCVTEEQGA